MSLLRSAGSVLRRMGGGLAASQPLLARASTSQSQQPIAAAAAPPGAGVLEVREYTIQPEGMGPYLALCQANAGLRSSLLPFLGCERCRTRRGGAAARRNPRRSQNSGGLGDAGGQEALPPAACAPACRPAGRPAGCPQALRLSRQPNILPNLPPPNAKGCSRATPAAR